MTASRLTAAALAALIPVALAAQEVTVATALGDTAVPANPETVVVLDIAAVDTLTALGVPIAGVPTPIYLPRLAGVAETATVVGTLFEPDYETIANLGPDLIVAGGRSSTVVPQLSEIAPTIDMTIWGDDHLGQVRARTAAYGQIFGLDAEAQALNDALDAKVAEVAAAVAGQGNALIVLTSGGAVSAYGAGSRFGWIHQALGLPEAVAGVDDQTHGEAISFEFIAEANPDWLIVVDRGAAIGEAGEAAAATLDNPLVAGTTAWTQGHVIYVDSADIYISGGGHGAMMNVLDQIGTAFTAD